MRGTYVVALVALGAFAPAAHASDSRCAVTEVAPGVKMRNANCPMFYARPQDRPASVDLPSDMFRTPPEANTFRFGSTELRVQGRVRGEMNVNRP
ncbi:hypothetical protein NK718_15260 [Alsobacter sp. SYSU M60028]|uniref:Uncharacterized protein n=1 Tax=Alsobacter ponti TaxID=2962936 RepID=A0ABT1LEF3_9HYPH|nr:hypothetical protein [Alsobacter ponti]MCP8939886.1 hypothetical protein [Alsobacter ponti]